MAIHGLLEIILSRSSCVLSGQEGALRLTDEGADTSATGTGVLEIFHAGAWGTVCDSDAGFELFELRGFPTDVPGVPPLTQVSCRVPCLYMHYTFIYCSRVPELSSMQAHISVHGWRVLPTLRWRSFVRGVFLSKLGCRCQPRWHAAS